MTRLRSEAREFELGEDEQQITEWARGIREAVVIARESEQRLRHGGLQSVAMRGTTLKG